jgi:hypothetical protein
MSHAIWHILKHRSNAFAGHGTALFTPPSQSPSRLLSRVMATRSKRSASETGAKHNSDIIKKPRVKASKEEATTKDRNRNQPVAAVSGQLNSVEGYCNALTSSLQAHSDPKRKEGSEKYLKHVVKARGLTCPQVCEICCGMFKQHPLDAAMQLPLADKLISSQYMEDKLAGGLQCTLPPQPCHQTLFALPAALHLKSSTQIVACVPACAAAILLLQHVLLPSGQYEWPALLAHMAGWYDSCHVYDWSTSDWLCMRPLHVMVTRCKDEGQREACCKVSSSKATWA